MKYSKEIQAALYEALKSIDLSILRYHNPHYEEVIQKAEQALAKAEGK